MSERYRPMSPFAVAFAAEYHGFMKASKVTGQQLADALDRNTGYVSERVNAKRPLDTTDVDALASLVEGWSGHALMIELARRAEAALNPREVIDLASRRVTREAQTFDERFDDEAVAKRDAIDPYETDDDV